MGEGPDSILPELLASQQFRFSLCLADSRASVWVMWFRNRSKDIAEANAALLVEIRAIGDTLEMGSKDIVEGATAPGLDAIDGILEVHARDIQEIRDHLKRLEIALAEGIEHEERRERRIKGTVNRARQKLRELDVEDPALESEWDGLSDEHGGGSPPGRLPEVPSEVEPPSEDGPSSVPGVSIGQLQRARGF